MPAETVRSNKASSNEMIIPQKYRTGLRQRHQLPEIVYKKKNNRRGGEALRYFLIIFLCAFAPLSERLLRSGYSLSYPIRNSLQKEK
jgi:hypothetical protein